MSAFSARHLVVRSLAYYWRTNVAVVLGVATAVMVLSGALLVGDSVRGSLRDLVLQRLGRTDLAVSSSTFFREQLTDDVRADPEFGAAFADVCPVVVVQGTVSEQRTGRHASGVQVYGVDDRFWRFHGAGDRGLTGREVLLSPRLARDIGADDGGTILLRVARPSEIPLESLHGRKEDPGRTLRLTVRAVLAPSDLGEFSLRPQQGEVRAMFVPLRRIQQDLERPARVNALLVSVRQGIGDKRQLEALLRRHAELADVGLTLRALPSLGVLSLGSDAGLIDNPRAHAASDAVARAGLSARPVLTYLVNSLRHADREIPYSLVTAIDLQTIAPEVHVPTDGSSPPVVLNEWAARELAAKIGDSVSLEYYVWVDPGRLLTRTASFRVAAVVPIAGPAADRDLAPSYPGITESENLRDWDPPFPVDLRRIRPADEDYWHAYRTTPKAFIPFEVGQTLWRSRYGALTSIRIQPAAGASLAEARDRMDQTLRAALDPTALALMVSDVRADGLAASRGATDFGEYFTYFSGFLMISALLLAALFFKLGVEQRLREVGLLRAIGFTTSNVRRLFVGEAFVLGVIGSALGLVGAIGYGQLMMAGLRSWWVDAVGTRAITLHVSASSQATGALAGIVAVVLCIWWTLRMLGHVSERSLMAGQLSADDGAAATRGNRRNLLVAGIGFAVLSGVLLVGTRLGWLDSTTGFFGAGTTLLAACLFVLTDRLRRPSKSLLQGRGWWPVARLGLRNVTTRPARSILSIAVIASATFILIAVGAFRRDNSGNVADHRSGAGGYSLLMESQLPIVHDPNSPDGRALMGLDGVDGVTIAPFRVLPGDDASCLNLYEPRSPRILGVEPDFAASGRFTFQSSLATTPVERANPWLMLEHDGAAAEAIPVMADANSMTYVLHRALGDEIVILFGEQPVRLRLVGALSDSIFQGELLMSDANFLRLFPEQQGYRFLLIEAPPERTATVAATLEDRLSDIGAEVVPTADRLAEFHRVENTYLSTFQTLGGLGLLLGTVGLAAVLLRNVLERRRELALLRAVGYRRAHFFAIVMAENVTLLLWGLLTGTLSALVAILPAAAERGGRVPVGTGAVLLVFSVFAAGVLSSALATRAAIRASLLDALRAE